VNEATATILALLGEVQRERTTRAADTQFGACVDAVKHWQQQRLRATYADLLANERYRAAATFFLNELYGPGDFGQRDAQFARVVPAMVRMFPAEVVHTVQSLAQLHALSERLDSEMGAAAATTSITDALYGRAWRAVGQPAERERQIALSQEIGTALDRHTRSRVLRKLLHLMRGPARAAGLGALQAFLEAGFDAFGAMGGAKEFLQTIAERERRLAAAWFAGGPD